MSLDAGADPQLQQSAAPRSLLRRLAVGRNDNTLGRYHGDFTSAAVVASLGKPELEYIPVFGAQLPAPSEGFFPSRSFSDDLSYGTGAAYIAGMALGAMWGVVQGLQMSHGGISSVRLRINSVLNAVGRRGTLVSSSLGVLAVLYNGINGWAMPSWPATEEYEELKGVASAAAAGAIFKSTAGLRAMLISSSLCAAGGVAYQAALQRYRLSKLSLPSNENEIHQ